MKCKKDSPKDAVRCNECGNLFGKGEEEIKNNHRCSKRLLASTKSRYLVKPMKVFIDLIVKILVKLIASD